MCIGSCSKLKISKFLGICSYGMYIFYFIFVQFMQFPVLHFGLAHSSSRPLKSYRFYETETRAVRKLSNPIYFSPLSTRAACKAKQLSSNGCDPLQAVQLVGLHKLYTLNGGAMSTSAAHCKKYMQCGISYC